jgi:phenylalanine-4-hydroxylase
MQDYVVPQNWDRFTAPEHATWATLFQRQAALLPGRACPEYLAGLRALDFAAGIPDFRALSETLHRLTGWQVVAVPGLVPDAVFFDHLANRRFPAGNFIRGADQLDYLQEPDMFHDVFGHVPMLTDPVFADYMQGYGRGGQRALRHGSLPNLARLYWYTVEFGLVRTDAGLRIYGAGIVSSASETVFALEDASPHRLGFALRRVLRTPYRIDDFQQTYFVIDSLPALLDETVNTDFAPLYRELASLPDIPIAAIEPADLVFTRGTQARAAAH